MTFLPPRFRAYTRESLVAEKTHTIAALGIADSRMKDFFDLWALSHSFSFAGTILVRAICSTFENRATPMPRELPIGLSDPFADDSLKLAQWEAFRRRLGGSGLPVSLPDIVIRLRKFLWPVLHAASGSKEFTERWDPLKGWLSAGKA